MEFRILKKSKKSKARAGIVKTEHGLMRTPAFFPVATQACVKTLDLQDIENIGFEGILANTYHLFLRPGSSLIKKMGGLHRFMNWSAVIATDSGGFQVFSLGKAIEQKTGKIKKTPLNSVVGEGKEGMALARVRITEKGVYFRSSIDGSEQFLSPEKSIQIQQDLGADIIFAFDECTSPYDSFDYTKRAMERTHRWAKRSLDAFNNNCSKSNDRRKMNQALFGIVQGGEYKKLREESARFIGSLPFDGFAIGGSFGKAKSSGFDILDWTIPLLDESKPRHFLGIGHLEDIVQAVKQGIDLFDCVYPTRFARHGIVLSQKEEVNLKKPQFLRDSRPLDKNCSCFVCKNYSRAYICHLLRAQEITAMRLVSYHNLWFFKGFMDELRQMIYADKI